MDEYKLLKKKLEKEHKKEIDFNFKKEIIKLINRCLISIIIFLITLILVKNNNTFKEQVYKNVYNNNISFLEIEEFCNKYLGSILPIDKQSGKEKTEYVSGEKLVYNDYKEIENGVKINLDKNTPIPAFESGIVLFAGEKDELGSTLIIEQTDGSEAWYVNVNYNDLKIYDYVEKDSIIGTSITDEVIFYFKKKGEVMDYKEYLF